MNLVGLLGPRLVVALDAASVSGAVLGRVPWTRRVRSVARVPLAPGALVPGPLEPNLARPQEVREALTALVETLQVARARALVLLPDGVARLALLDVPARTEAAAYAGFRLSSQLPYPAGEAIVDLLPVGGRRVVAAAVRRVTVAPYEAAVAEVGLLLERVDLAPLAALAGRLHGGSGPGPGVDVILGDAAICLAAFDGRNLAALRSRRRDPGPDEATWLREEVDRTAALAGLPPEVRVRIVGAGAPALARDLSFGGRPAEPGWPADRSGLALEPAELAWYGVAWA